MSRWRFGLVALLLASLMSSCGGTSRDEGDDENGSSSEQVAGPAPVFLGDVGVSVDVRSVAGTPDGVTLELRVVNVRDDALGISRSYDPMELTDDRGSTYVAAENVLSVPAYSAGDLTVTFAGTPNEGASRLQFKTSTNRLGIDPLVEDIPFRANEILRFESRTAAAAPIENAVAYNANGTSVALRRISVLPDSVEIDFLAVYGGRDASELARELVRLTDDRGRQLVAVPPVNASTLELPPGGRLSGTLRFPGRLPADARTLTLAFNSRLGSDVDRGRSPKLVIDGIAVPGGV